MGDKGVKENNRKGWIDENKVYPQWGYIHIETPLNINLNINNEGKDCKIDIVCIQRGY
jgi:hypothetical protein